jgi:hypothetical protein
MGQNLPEPSIEESIQQVMHTLPPPIRRYLGQGKYSVVANGLMKKYGLHADQGGILEREIMLLLMGIENPDEFTQALVGEAQLDQQTVNSIVQDVNAQIFLPLREEMRNGTQNTQPPVPPSVPPPVPQLQEPPRMTMPVPPPRVNAPIPNYASSRTVIPANPQMPVRESQVVASMLKYTPPPPRPASSVNAFSRGPFGPASRSVNTPSAPQMLEDHEEPHIEFRAPAPRVAPPPPPNLPGAMPNMDPMAEPPMQSINRITQPPAAPPSPMRSYSSDPYHEPIDEGDTRG